MPAAVRKLEIQHVKKAGGKSEQVSVLESGITPMNIPSKLLTTSDVAKMRKVRRILAVDNSPLCSMITCDDNQIILVWADLIQVYCWPELHCIGSLRCSRGTSPIMFADSNGLQITACCGACVSVWDINCTGVGPRPVDIRRPGVSVDRAICIKCTKTEVVIATFRGD